MTKRKIGVQLYTLRKPFAEDPLGTLTRIRKIGYDTVEFAAPLDLDYKELGAHLKDIGLACPSAHVGLSDIESRADDVLDMGSALGCEYLVLPFVFPDDRDWSRVISSLSKFAETADQAGFKTAYHHHDCEFHGEPGQRPFDLLMEKTDPARVYFELDVYWLKTAGEDPKAMIERLGTRVQLLHLKDWRDDGAMADVGSGVLDFPALLAAGEAAGVRHMFVEHDMPPQPYWPSVETSLNYLRGLD